MSRQIPNRCIVLKVAARYQRAAGDLVDLRTIEITAENMEQVLQMLVSDLDNLEEVEAALGIDLRNMTSLMRKYPHNDDIHHNGEDVLTHIKWVLEDIADLTHGMEAERKVVLHLAALMHDLGKAYTFAIIDGRSTFRKHAEKSVAIAEALLAQHRDKLGSLYDRVLDLVRIHDMFMVLANARPAAKNLSYLNKFLRERVYLDGHIDDLFTLAKADSHRAKRYQESLEAAEAVLRDIREVERKRAEEATAAPRRQQALLDHRAEVEALLADVPEALAAMPDLPTVNQALGKAKRYDLLQTLKGITG